LPIVTFYVTMGNMSLTVEPASRVRAPQAADWALAHGIGALTTVEAATLLGVPPDQVRRRLAVPAKRGEWVCPARGLWVPVEPRYRAAGGPPGVELIGDLARHLGVSYYVGWLSAAERYGAAHHAPQVFQVAVSRPVEDRRVGRARMQFHRRDRVGEAPTSALRTYSGDVPFSTPAVTALDVASDPRLAGGLDNAANIVIDLVGEAGLTAADVADAAQWFPVAAVRRVGWIMATHTDSGDLAPLLRAARAGEVPSSPLHPAYPGRGRVDQVWGLALNVEVDPDT
jgi:predicted transcriptional regulator of viral defense system